MCTCMSKITNERLNSATTVALLVQCCVRLLSSVVWHRMLYSCTHGISGRQTVKACNYEQQFTRWCVTNDCLYADRTVTGG